MRSEAEGVETRQHLRLLAARGNERAIAALAGPQVPEELEYLRTWACELVGRSGVGMSGLAPLSVRELEAWERKTHRHVEAWEVEVLIRLDAILRNPDLGADADAPEGAGE